MSNHKLRFSLFIILLVAVFINNTEDACHCSLNADSPAIKELILVPVLAADFELLLDGEYLLIAERNPVGSA